MNQKPRYRKMLSIALAIGILLLVIPPVHGEEFSHNLSYGLRNNPDVSRLQQFLRESGFYSGPITGNFFSLTRGAVRRFQRTFNLPATGFFGPLSRQLAGQMSIPITPSETTQTSTIPPVATTPTPPTTAPIAPVPSSPLITTAPTAFPGCIQMDSSQNNLSERRINLVFVGANYASANDFAEVVKLAADPNAQGHGFFSVEPFRSNRDKFNILYTATSLPIREEMNTVPLSDEARAAFRNALAACNYENRFGFALVNTQKNLLAPNIGEVSGTANAIPPEQGFISVFPYPVPDADALRRAQGLVLHEGGGHMIGALFDEYVTPTWLTNPATINQTYPAFQNQCYALEPTALACQQIGGGVYNCNFAANPQTEQTCTAQSAWRDLIGNGCGRDGVVDCTEDDQNYSREIRCWQSRCSVNSFGSVGAGIMESEFNVRNFFFGAQNERLICRRIQDLTGSVGGICNSLCLAGCPVGQFCGAGTCRTR